MFILVQDTTFVIGLAALALSAIAYLRYPQRQSPQYLVNGIVLTVGAFGVGLFLHAVGWLLTGDSRIDESLGLVTDTITFPAAVVTRSIAAPVATPNPSSDPSIVVDVLSSIFILVEDTAFVVALVGISLGLLRRFVAPGRRGLEWLTGGMVLSAVLFGFGIALHAASWLLTGETRLDQSLGLVTQTVTLPASTLTRAVSPPTGVSTTTASAAFPVHILGRVLALEVLLVGLLGLVGVMIGGVLYFAAGNNTQQGQRGAQWVRGGLIATVLVLSFHLGLRTVAWLVTGTTSFDSGARPTIDTGTFSTTSTSLPRDAIVNHDLIYPLVPTESGMWQVTTALQDTLQLTATTATWLSLIAITAGATVYAAQQNRASERGPQWVYGGIVLLLILLTFPLLVATGSYLITGQGQALTEFSGGAAAQGSTWESQTVEGWSSSDGGLDVIATNDTRRTYGLYIFGDGSKTYDVAGETSTEFIVGIAVERGSLDVTIRVDGTTVAIDSIGDGTHRLRIPTGDRVTVLLEGFDAVVEEVVVQPTPDP
jgi:hypothetical protein